MTTSHLLAMGFDLTWQGAVERTSAHCSLCGVHIAECVPLAVLLKATASDIADTFRYSDSDVVCPWCAACYAAPRLLTGSLFATPDYAVKPTVSDQPDRPRWCDLLAILDAGTECTAIITSNTKRRLWPAAVVSRFGANWRPLFVHETTERLLTVDVCALRECLALVTEIYSAGYTKAAIASTLLHTLSASTDRASLLNYERQLRRWRNTDEFLVSLYMAQKRQEE